MTSCPLYNDSNLDSTGNKMNNPYELIQRAGKYKKGKKSKSKTSKKRRNYKKRITRKKTKKVRFSKNLFF